jgi:hypothetical protein
MVGGYAAEDGSALHFVGEDLARVVSSRPTATAHRVEDVDGEVMETRLAADYLGGTVSTLATGERGTALAA